MRLLTLLSDFGSASPYPAAMKAVVAARVEVVFLDITHDVPRHDVQQGAYLLAAVVPCCPPGTVHLAVVDPGVGTARRPLVVRSGGHLFVGPDNGLLLPAARRLGQPQAWALDPAVALPGASATFHGRDLFAPAAARLLAGEPPDRLGSPVTDLVDLAWPAGRREGEDLVGEVLYSDPFGNLITSIPATLLPHAGTLRLETPGGAREVAVRRTYGEGAPGELLVLAGSDGLVEIAVREGSAAAALRLGPGAPVRLRPV